MIAQRPPSAQAGFTLVELLVAIFVLLVGVLAVVALVDGANRTTSDNRAREGATNLTREIIEDARSVTYGALDQATLAPTISALSGGSAQPDGTIVYSRRGVTYSSAPSLCYVDDPKDGYGSHAGATYCGGVTGAADSYPKDYKRFTVVTTWSGAKGSGTSRQSAVFNDPGSSFAPRIAAFSMTSPSTCTGSPACTQVDAGLTSSASFSVTTSVPAAKVTWYVNDMQMGLATGSGTGPWTFSWPLATVATGSYTVSVRASAGKEGAARTIVVPVKASTVGPPTNPYGGENQLWPGVVELNWTPIAASVLGYEVERRVGGVWSAPINCYEEKGVTLANPRPTGGYCLDKAAAGATEYRIFTKYLLNGTPTSTTTSAAVQIVSNLRPCRPGNLSVSSGGTVTWTAPASAGGCDATRIRFFRVYRRVVGGSGSLPVGTLPALSERSFKTSGPTVLQWTDPANTNKTNYWVSSIDDFNAESNVVGPTR